MGASIMGHAERGAIQHSDNSSVGTTTFLHIWNHILKLQLETKVLKYGFELTEKTNSNNNSKTCLKPIFCLVKGLSSHPSFMNEKIVVYYKIYATL